MLQHRSSGMIMVCLCLCACVGEACVCLCAVAYACVWKDNRLAIEGATFLSRFVPSYSHKQTHNPSHQGLMPRRTESLVCCITENSVGLLCLRTLLSCVCLAAGRTGCVLFCFVFFSIHVFFTWALKRWSFFSFQIVSMPTLHAQLTPKAQ